MISTVVMRDATQGDVTDDHRDVDEMVMVPSLDEPLRPPRRLNNYRDFNRRLAEDFTRTSPEYTVN